MLAEEAAKVSDPWDWASSRVQNSEQLCREGKLHQAALKDAEKMPALLLHSCGCACIGVCTDGGFCLRHIPQNNQHYTEYQIYPCSDLLELFPFALGVVC